MRELLDAVDPDASDDEAVPHVHGDHPLGLALTRMGATRHTVLPVVSRANVRHDYSASSRCPTFSGRTASSTGLRRPARALMRR